jgi:pyruvate/2-oxoglutarate dehydrogenase complex dihydrolipoamide acyltransferase (E2) component
MAERVSWGRFEYLISAFIVAVVVFWLLTLVQHFIFTFKDQNVNLWLAGRAGALGAFFSIALAIRNRTVLTNLRRRDNVSDASLRIMIGAIAGGVLVLLLGSDLLSEVKFAGQIWSGSNLTWQKVLGIGFIGGFLERLVPDLLARYEYRPSTPTSTVPASARTGQVTASQRPANGAPTPSRHAEPTPAAAAREAAQKAAESQEAALAAAAQGAPDVAAAHAAAAQAAAAHAAAQASAAHAGASERR